MGVLVLKEFKSSTIKKSLNKEVLCPVVLRITGWVKVLEL